MTQNMLGLQNFYEVLMSRNYAKLVFTFSIKILQQGDNERGQNFSPLKL